MGRTEGYKGPLGGQSSPPFLAGPRSGVQRGGPKKGAVKGWSKISPNKHKGKRENSILMGGGTKIGKKKIGRDPLVGTKRKGK